MHDLTFFIGRRCPLVTPWLEWTRSSGTAGVLACIPSPLRLHWANEGRQDACGPRRVRPFQPGRH